MPALLKLFCNVRVKLENWGVNEGHTRHSKIDPLARRATSIVGLYIKNNWNHQVLVLVNLFANHFFLSNKKF